MRWFLLLSAMALPAPAAAQAPPPGPEASSLRLNAAPASGAIHVDGRLDEASWQAAPAATGFIQKTPQPGDPATERTEARVLWSDDALYVGMRLYDTHADSVVARLGRRDAEVPSDWASVYIDSQRDQRTAYGFSVNAAGVRADSKFSDDDQEDTGWDAVWEAAVTRDDGGWTAEFRIPYSQLRFDGEAEPGGRTWGVQFGRTIFRRSEDAFWAPEPNDASVFVSRFGELTGVGAISPPLRMEIMPYVSGRVTRSPGDAADPFYHANQLGGATGADVRLGLGPALTLSATVNPDFGQVEADPSVVNLTAYPTFFPEKRPFFVEGADLFRSPGPTVFYSRRIGRAPQGRAPASARWTDAPEASTILGALKLSGKTEDGWSVGVLDAVTGAEDVRYIDASGAQQRARVEPLTNYAVARVARDFRAGRSGLGGIVSMTNRRLDDAGLDFLDASAAVAGIDGRHRFGGDHYEMAGSVTGSRIAGSSTAIGRVQAGAGHYYQRPDADYIEYDPTRTSLTGVDARASLARISGGAWRWSANMGWTTPGFEINDLGYSFGSDRASESLNLHWLRYGHGVRRLAAHAGQHSAWTTGMERRELDFTLDADLQTNAGWGVTVWGMRHFGGITPDALRGGPALYYPGRWMGYVYGYTDPRRPVTATFYLYGEDEIGTGSRNVSTHMTVEAHPTPALSLSVTPSLARAANDWQYVTTRTVAGSPFYVLSRIERTTAAVQLRAGWTFRPDLSLELYAQPFIASGNYSSPVTVADPRAADFAARFHRFGPAELAVSDEDGVSTWRITPAADPAAAFSLAPDFNVRQLRGNAVLRWEWRPGSTLYVVWSQERSGYAPVGDFSLSRDLRGLGRAPARNVLLLKASYWLGS